VTTAVGRSTPRNASAAKVRGTAEYIHNLVLPGMLHAAIVRSQHARGTDLAVATDRATAVPGVVRVVTAADAERLLDTTTFGPAFHDRPVLATDEVRYVGEPVAVVVATSIRAARAAAELVEVDLEPSPGVFDPVEAATPGAPLVHETLRPGVTFPDLAHLRDVSGTNVAMTTKLRHGDLERSLAGSELVYDHTFTTSAVVHTPLEPNVVVVEPTDNGVTAHSATQSPSFVRAELARLLGWPEHRVRVRTAFLGGGFGAKLYMHIEPIALVCALATGRPVRLALTMDEQFLTISRHGTVVRLRTGVRRDGTFVARRCEIWWNGGAYADIGPRVGQKSGFVAAGPYRFEAVSIDSHVVYTNLTPAGAMRGFGIPQVVFAYESQTDIIAQDLGMDPVALRRLNLLREGDVHHSGTPTTGARTGEVLEELVERMAWDDPFDTGEGSVRRGRGVAIALKAVVTPSTSVATVSLSGDGSVTAYCSTADVGQGSETAYAQLVAEVLGVDEGDVHVVHADTDVTPYDMGTLGSRSLYHVGNALVAAATDVRDQVLATAGTLLDVDPGQLRLYAGSVLNRDGQDKLTLRDLMRGRFGMQGGNLIGSASFTPPYERPDPETGRSSAVTAFWMVGAAGAEVEVDIETGKVRVTRAITIGDCGRLINPTVVRTQLTGGAIMQLGMTLSEEMRYEGGQLTNAGLGFYKIPSIQDVPVRIEGIAVPSHQHDGPFGAKGVGEIGTFALSPAVANAVAHATGARLFGLPLTPDRVATALADRPLDSS
jgi:CO/xanthine dehydrogenase Mo-binding subunit